MKETEVKILDVNKSRIVERLEGLGAEKIFDDIMIGRIYDYKDNRIIGRKDGLRLRKEGKDVKLTYKKFISRDGYKEMDEHEVNVGSFEDMDRILKEIGMIVLREIKKHRLSYMLDGCRIEIDTSLENYSCIPTFIEIEGKKENILAVAGKLGFSESSFTSYNFSDMIDKYCEKCIEVDENDNEIGVRPKPDFMDGRYIHRGAHLLLFNKDGKVLIQKRAKDKKWYPDTYEFSVSGTVAVESYEECIIREAKEELGIIVEVEELFKFPFFYSYDKAWHTLFKAEYEGELNPEKSIQEVKWVSLDWLKKDIEENKEKYAPPFVEAMNIFFKKVFDKAP